jgi:hypothetical protein
MQKGLLVLSYLRDFSFATEPCMCGHVLANALSGREVPAHVQTASIPSLCVFVSQKNQMYSLPKRTSLEGDVFLKSTDSAPRSGVGQSGNRKPLT